KKTEADKAAAAAAAAKQQAASTTAPPPSAPAQATQPAPRPAPTHVTQPQPAQTTETEASPAQPEAPPPKPARAPGSLPAVVSSAQPNYPPEALRDGVSGEVTVSFTVNPDGSVSGATIVSSNPRRVFDAAALEAIRKWKFEAPGEAVTGRRTFAFNPGN
ncbi:MAG TPA: energy transducer TonB, partial [Xanthomonadaceae bacterium]|nr:energy transducer TonB [Xanthomonadaceae bacterium]